MKKRKKKAGGCSRGVIILPNHVHTEQHVIEYEPIGSEVSGETTILQAVKLLEIASHSAVVSGDFKRIVEACKLWTELGVKLGPPQLSRPTNNDIGFRLET